jgi:hypothetical protein
MRKIAMGFNEAGTKHLDAELARLGLDWDRDATATVICGKDGFQDIGVDGACYEYEISNVRAGKKSYGVHGTIEIGPEHVWFDEVEDDD